ncbi:MAG TPA: Crp/Fnr family transcriptional regulator [Sphingomicrobium sp.]|nr:Crp/Fnr family transcriptional regulator [Sphingomicrobium sp.]
MDLAADELERIDHAFARNRLLATFPREARALLEPFGELTDLAPGDLVLRRGEDVGHSLFPFGSTMVSMIVDVDGGRSIEVASIGQEGAIGGIVSCGQAPAFTRAVTLIGGPALSVPMAALEDAKKRSPFIEHLFCRYSDFLLAQVMQSLACNAFHSVDARAAGWLLTAQDRAGDRLELTQEAFAGLLGVQRTTVNAVVQQLQDENLISKRRGVIHIVDRVGLKRRSCDCHAALKSHYARVIGAGGSGG